MPRKPQEFTMDDVNQDPNNFPDDLDEQGNPRQGRRRHPAKRSADMARINALMMQGLTADEVAVRLNLDRHTIHRELATLNKLWLRQIEEDAASFRAILLHRAMELEAISMEGFHESKEKVVTDSANSEKHGVSTNVKTYHSSGDPAFLNSARECLKLQMQILGLDNAPSNTKVFDKDAFLDEVARRIEEAKQKPIALPVEAVEVKEVKEERVSPFD